MMQSRIVINSNFPYVYLRIINYFVYSLPIAVMVLNKVKVSLFSNLIQNSQIILDYLKSWCYILCNINYRNIANINAPDRFFRIFCPVEIVSTRLGTLILLQQHVILLIDSISIFNYLLYNPSNYQFNFLNPLTSAAHMKCWSYEQ